MLKSIPDPSSTSSAFLKTGTEQLNDNMAANSMHVKEVIVF